MIWLGIILDVSDIQMLFLKKNIIDFLKMKKDIHSLYILQS